MICCFIRLWAIGTRQLWRLRKRSSGCLVQRRHGPKIALKLRIKEMMLFGRSVKLKILIDISNCLLRFSGVSWLIRNGLNKMLLSLGPGWSGGTLPKTSFSPDASGAWRDVCVASWLPDQANRPMAFTGLGAPLGAPVPVRAKAEIFGSVKK